MVVRRAKILAIVGLLILLSFNAEAESKNISWIEGKIELEFLDGCHLKVKLKLNVHNITVYGKVYGADEIRSNLNEISAFKSKIYDLVSDVFDQSFGNCEFNLGIPYEDKNSLSYPADQDIYNPPVTFYIDGNLTLSRNFFNSNINNISDFVNAMLDSGASITYNFNFYAPLNWNITYVVRISDYMMIEEESNGEMSIDGKEVKWEINNWKTGEEKFKNGKVKIKEKEPTSRMVEEKVRVNVSFDLRNPDKSVLKLRLDAESLDLSNIISLPEFVSNIEIFPSDCVRLLVREGLISWDNLREVMNNKWNIFEEDMENIFQRNLTLKVKFNDTTTYNCSQPFNITNMDTTPPISMESYSYLDKFLGDFSARAIIGIIYSGGKIRLDENLINLKPLRYPFDAEIVLPYGEIYGWNGSKKLNLTLDFENSPKYKEDKIERLVEIDIVDVDLDLIDFITGNTNIIGNINIRDNHFIYRVYAHNLINLPSWIDIYIINSDLFRLLIEEKLLKNTNLTRFFGNRINASREIISSLTGGTDYKIIQDKDIFEKSLKWDKNVENMDDNKPINVSFFSSVSKKSKFSLSFIPFSLYVFNESFNCLSTPGENITYRFIFPKGVEIKCEDSLGRVTTGVTKDGRNYIEIHFSKDEGLVASTVYYSLKFSPLITLLIFLPFILIIIVIIAIISIIALIGRRRKMKSKKIIIAEEKSEEGEKSWQQ